MWLTVIFFSIPADVPLRGLNKFTCSPTLIFFVRAPCGKTACTCGTTLDDTMPPSGPIACTSWRMRDTTAKYWGKSVVRIRVMRPEPVSSRAVNSANNTPAESKFSELIWPANVLAEHLLILTKLTPSWLQFSAANTKPTMLHDWDTFYLVNPSALGPFQALSSHLLLSLPSWCYLWGLPH